MQADLDATLRRIAVHAESDPSVNDARADRYRRADEIGRRARAEADSAMLALSGFGDSAEPLRAIARYVVDREV